MPFFFLYITFSDIYTEPSKYINSTKKVVLIYHESHNFLKYPLILSVYSLPCHFRYILTIIHNVHFWYYNKAISLLQNINKTVFVQTQN